MSMHARELNCQRTTSRLVYIYFEAGTCETIHYFDAPNIDKSIVFSIGN
jgi:hypothetical protein